MTDETKTSKILAVGDIHGNARFAKKLAERARDENVDLVILAGDIVFSESNVKDVIGHFAEVKKQVLMIPGNHESFATIDFLAEMYDNAKNIHGYSFVKGDLGIFGAGGATIGPFESSEREIMELLKKGHERVKDSRKKIMVTHMHFEGSKAEFGMFEGSNSIMKAAKYFQPDILINAHIHEAGGMEEMIGKTRVINVSRREAIFEI